jgi:hypothetical protein
MNRIILLLVTGFLFITSVAFAENIYISQTAQGSNRDTNCGNAHSVVWFNVSSNWSKPKASGKIGPGDTVHLCGVITTSLTGSSNVPLLQKDGNVASF